MAGAAADSVAEVSVAVVDLAEALAAVVILVAADREVVGNQSESVVTVVKLWLKQ